MGKTSLQISQPPRPHIHPLQSRYCKPVFVRFDVEFVQPLVGSPEPYFRFFQPRVRCFTPHALIILIVMIIDWVISRQVWLGVVKIHGRPGPNGHPFLFPVLFIYQACMHFEFYEQNVSVAASTVEAYTLIYTALVVLL